MAAHVKTALEQLVAGNFHYDQLLPAFKLSSWTEDLDFTDYCDFLAIVKSYATFPDNERHDMVKNVARMMLPKYTGQWEELGKPDNREGWRVAKWGSNAL